jgi:hypothetical protein
MAKRQRNLCLIAVAFFSILSVEASMADCVCPGAATEEFAGGDGKPLTWLFQIHPMSPGNFDLPPLICYFRSVSNQSTSEIRNVYWEIADYDRRILPAGASVPSCAQIQKRISPHPANGPLFYAVSSSYPTTVRQPLNGWRDGQAIEPFSLPEIYGQFQYQIIAARSETQPKYPPIRSAFKIFVTENSWADIGLNSVARPKDGNFTEFSYEFTNSGNASIWLIANIPVADSAVKDVPIAQRWTELPPGASKAFTSTVAEPPQLGKTATIVFYDLPSQKVLGIDLAGVYVPEGAKPVRTEMDLRKRFQIQ